MVMIGAVAIWAAKETARRFESSSDGGFFIGHKTVRFASAYKGFLRSSMVKSAATESWKPGL